MKQKKYTVELHSTYDVWATDEMMATTIAIGIANGCNNDDDIIGQECAFRHGRGKCRRTETLRAMTTETG